MRLGHAVETCNKLWLTKVTVHKKWQNIKYYALPKILCIVRKHSAFRALSKIFGPSMLCGRNLQLLALLSKSLHFSRLSKNFALCQKSMLFLGNPCALSTFPQDFVLSQKVVLLHLQLPMMTIHGVSTMHFLAKATDIFLCKKSALSAIFLFASFLLSKLRSFFLPKTFSFNLKPTHCLVQLVHFLNNFCIQNSHTFYAKKMPRFLTSKHPAFTHHPCLTTRVKDQGESDNTTPL